MSALSDNLARLFRWLEGIELLPPSEEVRILEVSPDILRAGRPTGCGHDDVVVLLLDFRSRVQENRRRQVKVIDQVLAGIGEESRRRARLRVSRDQLRKPSDYDSRFDELLKEGFSWLNMSCYGVYDGFVIVAIEVPYRERGTLRPGIVTPVNFSGPSASVSSRGWNVEELLLVE
ncbi:MAG: hypothetical protein WA609_12070 [Terriglobales bacterium]